MKKLLYRQRHWLIPFAIPMMIGLLLFLGVAEPLMTTMHANRVKVVRLKQEIVRIRGAINSKTQLEKEVEKSQKDYQAVLQLLHPPRRISQHMDEIGVLARRNGVDMVESEIPTETQKTGVRELTVPLKLSGPYIQQLRFLQALESHRPLYRIDQLQMVHTPAHQLETELTVTLLIKPDTLATP